MLIYDSLEVRARWQKIQQKFSEVTQILYPFVYWPQEANNVVTRKAPEGSGVIINPFHTAWSIQACGASETPGCLYKHHGGVMGWGGGRVVPPVREKPREVTAENRSQTDNRVKQDRAATFC